MLSFVNKNNDNGRSLTTRSCRRLPHEPSTMSRTKPAWSLQGREMVDHLGLRGLGPIPLISTRQTGRLESLVSFSAPSFDIGGPRSRGQPRCDSVSRLFAHAHIVRLALTTDGREGRCG